MVTIEHAIQIRPTSPNRTATFCFSNFILKRIASAAGCHPSPTIQLSRLNNNNNITRCKRYRI